MITLKGRVPSKKNSKIMVCRGSKPILLPSSSYKVWHEDVSWQLKAYRGLQGIDKAKITLTFYAPDKRATDLTNKAESIMDLLVDNGILKDDNWFVCNDVHLKFGGVDKDNPRVEIEIQKTTE